MSIKGRFIVWYCAGCRRYTAKENRKEIIKDITLKCIRCNKSIKLKKANELGLSTDAHFFGDAREAGNFVRFKNEDIYK